MSLSMWSVFENILRRHPPTTSCRLLCGLLKGQHPVVDHVSRLMRIKCFYCRFAKRNNLNMAKRPPQSNGKMFESFFQNCSDSIIYMQNVKLPNCIVNGNAASSL